MDTQTERYHESIRALSDRIVEAQRPVRVLDATNWDDTVRKGFFDSGCTELPRVDAAYYAGRPLGFDPVAKRIELGEIARDIRRTLGRFNSLGRVMERMCDEYVQVVDMLDARGTPEFTLIAQHLYGSSSDAFHANQATVADMAHMLSETLGNLGKESARTPPVRDIDAQQAVALLEQALSPYFASNGAKIGVRISDGIVSDAAAGADYIKIRADARFSKRDIRVLEIHEGWVHLGTTFNGLAQPICTFLSKGAPSSTVTQEGLAVLMEIFSFASHPSRVRRLTDRVHAVRMAEEGADFLQTFAFFIDQEYTQEDAYNVASRVYRGSTPVLGPFTKDLVYTKGFALVYNFVRAAVKRGVSHRIPLLFAGKCALEDIGFLAEMVEEGIVTPPRFVPPPFDDVDGLAAWMAYANFLDRLDLDRIEADYASLF